MNININFTIIEPTEPLKAYARQRAEDLATYFEHIISVDIDLGRTSDHHEKGKVFYAQYNVGVPGSMVQVRKEAEDLYKAIEKVKDHMKVELGKHKGKTNQIDREMIRETKAYHDDASEDGMEE
jgi:ribosomal subunit interface protein